MSIEIPTPEELKNRQETNVQKTLKLCADAMNKSQSLHISVTIKEITDAEFEAVKLALKSKGWAVTMKKCAPNVHNLHYFEPELTIQPN